MRHGEFPILYWTTSFNRAPFRPHIAFSYHTLHLIMSLYRLGPTISYYNHILFTMPHCTAATTKIIILLCESRVYFKPRDDKNQLLSKHTKLSQHVSHTNTAMREHVVVVLSSQGTHVCRLAGENPWLKHQTSNCPYHESRWQWVDFRDLGVSFSMEQHIIQQRHGMQYGQIYSPLKELHS